MKEFILNRWKLLIVIGSVIILIATMVVVSLSKPKTEDTVDIYSGEITSNPANREPELAGQPVATPTYYGFVKLIDRGLTFDQTESVKGSVTSYLYTKKINSAEISLDVESINKDLSNDSFDLVTFPIIINDQERIVVEVYLYSLLEIKTVIKSGDTQVYSSGKIKLGSKEINEEPSDGNPYEEQLNP